jgi:hypothetical protein
MQDLALMLLSAVGGLWMLALLARAVRRGSIYLKGRIYPIDEAGMFSLSAAFYVVAAALIPMVTVLYVRGIDSPLGAALLGDLQVASVRADGGLAFGLRVLVLFLVVFSAFRLGLGWRRRR